MPTGWARRRPKLLAQEGVAVVVLVDINEAALKIAVPEVEKEATNPNFKAVPKPVDVSKEDQVLELFEGIKKDYGRIRLRTLSLSRLDFVEPGAGRQQCGGARSCAFSTAPGNALTGSRPSVCGIHDGRCAFCHFPPNSFLFLPSTTRSSMSTNAASSFVGPLTRALPRLTRHSHA